MEVSRLSCGRGRARRVPAASVPVSCVTFSGFVSCDRPDPLRVTATRVYNYIIYVARARAWTVVLWSVNRICACLGSRARSVSRVCARDLEIDALARIHSLV